MPKRYSKGENHPKRNGNLDKRYRLEDASRLLPGHEPLPAVTWSDRRIRGVGARGDPGPWRHRGAGAQSGLNAPPERCPALRRSRCFCNHSLSDTHRSTSTTARSRSTASRIAGPKLTPAAKRAVDRLAHRSIARAASAVCLHAPHWSMIQHCVAAAGCTGRAGCHSGEHRGCHVQLREIFASARPAGRLSRMPRWQCRVSPPL